MAFIAIRLIDAARHSGDGHWLRSDYNIFLKMTPYRTAIMDEGLVKFVCDSMQQSTKKTSLRIFNVKFLTCNVFVFYKNLLSRLRSSYSRHNVDNRVKCK